MRDTPEEEPETPADCLRARRYLATFVGVSGGGGKDEEPFFRSHLTACRECMLMYRETMATAARLGRSIRLEKTLNEREQRQTDFKARAIQATATGKRSNRFGLRLALLPAGIALALILFRSGGGTDGLLMRWTSGDVRVAGQALGDEQPTMVVSRGDYCETGPGAEAELCASEDAEEVVFRLGTESVLHVVDTRRRSVRLEKGSVTLHGRGTVTSSYGVLLVEAGSARLRVGDGTFDVTCLAGELSWVGPTESRQLSAGDRIEAESLLAGLR